MTHRGEDCPGFRARTQRCLIPLRRAIASVAEVAAANPVDDSDRQALKAGLRGAAFSMFLHGRITRQELSDLEKRIEEIS